jgi:predicted  nucleic acid-binding Zn-ribbon protein
MRNHVTRRLSTLSEEISRTRAELARLRERLAVQVSVLEQALAELRVEEQRLASADV